LIRISIRGVFVVLAGIVCTQAAVGQTTITVPGDEATIQDGIDAAVNGDTVLVSPGTYFELLNLNGKEITLASANGPTATIIDGGGSGPVITAVSGETLNTVVQGFTIQNGMISFGAGIYIVNGTPTIRGNIFDSNVQPVGGYGAAIAGNSSSPLIDGNVFTNNSCDTQHLAGVISFINSSAAIIVNNVFLNNPCRGVNIVSIAGQTHEISNNTFAANNTAIRVSIFSDASGQLVRNNILFQNTVGYEDIGSDSPPFLNNLVFGNTSDYVGITNQTGSNGNIAQFPLFENLPGGSVRINALSPARDAGGNGPAALPTFDFEGDNRVIGGTVDIGADEFDPTPVAPVSRVYSLLALAVVFLLVGAYGVRNKTAAT